jgi:hypothetical protein
VDECWIGGKRKGDHGRLPAPAELVFGIFCRTTKRLLLFPIPDRSRESIVPLIIEHVAEGA